MAMFEKGDVISIRHTAEPGIGWHQIEDIKEEYGMWWIKVRRGTLITEDKFNLAGTPSYWVPVSQITSVFDVIKRGEHI